MKTMTKKYQRMLLAASVFGLLLHGGIAEAATYTQGISGNLNNKQWLEDVDVTGKKENGQITFHYDFNGKDDTFNITHAAGSARETPIYARANTGLVINNEGGTLHLNVNNKSSGAFNGNSAIMATAGNNFTINSNLDMSVKADYLAQAIRVEDINSHVTISGDVKIRKDDASNPWGIVTNNTHGNFSYYKGARWAPSLIWNHGNSGSSVTIRGNFDGASRGSGLVTDPYGMTNNNPYTTCFINLIDGDIRIETPESQNEAYYAIANYGGTINVNVLNGEAQAKNRVTLLGNVIAMNDNVSPYYVKGRVNIGLTTKDSSWTGIIDNSGKAQAGQVNLWLRNGASWNHESRSMKNGLQSGNMPDQSRPHYGTYDGVSYLTNLIGGDEGHAGIISQRDSASIDIQNLQKHVVIDYQHANAGESVSDYSAGDVTIHHAEAGSQVTLSTDNHRINMNDTVQVENVLGALAQKLYYTAGDSNLTGKVQITEGLVASGASKMVGDLKFISAKNGQASYQDGTAKKETGIYISDDPNATDTPGTPDIPDIPDIPNIPDTPSYTDYETGLMKGTRQAVMASMFSWRDNAADTIHRSDVLRNRLPGEKDGVWGKVSSGRLSYGDGSSNEDSYTTFQTGYDKSFGDSWIAGVGVDYHTGNTSFSYGGSGKEKLYSLNLYGSKDLGENAYWDVTGKVGYVTNDFTAYNQYGRKLDGSYSSRGYSLSTQIGKRYDYGSTYIEPQVQLTWAYLAGKNFENTSEEDTMFVHHQAFNSFVGRIGVEAGKINGKSSLYSKVNINHEFAGDVKGNYSDGNGNLKSTSYDTKGTWWDAKVGVSHQMFNAGNVYAEIGKSFGGKAHHDWKFDAGLRFLIGQGHTPGQTYKGVDPIPSVQENRNSTDTKPSFSSKEVAMAQTVSSSESEKKMQAPAMEETVTTYMPIMSATDNGSTGAPIPMAMDGTTYILGPVVVTASRIRQPILEAKADISVVSRKEMEDYHIGNVEEALRTVPGVQFTNYSTNQMNGNLSGIRINGSSDIVILVDGVKITDFNGPGNSGYAYTSVMSNPDNIERVEVLRGSAAAMYGSGAKGGVINIITRKINKTATTVDISKGTSGKENYRFNTQGAKGKFAYNLYNDRTLTGSFKDGDGVHWDGHTNTKAWGGKFVWNFNENHEFLYSYDETVTNYNGFDPIYIGPYNGIRSMKIHTLKDSWTLSDHWSNTLTYRRSEEYGVYKKPWGEGSIFGSVNLGAFSDTRDYTYDFISDQVNYHAKDHDLVFGIDYSKASGASVNTGTDTGTTSNGNHVVKNTSIYAQDEWKFLPKLTLTVGVRHDMPNLDQAPSHTAESYKLGWDMTEKDSVYISRNDYYIMPSLDQLYGTTGSNDSLKPASGKTTSVGYNRKFSDRTFFTFNWYYTKADSDITMVEERDEFDYPLYDDNGNIKWHYENSSNKTHGWNAQLESQLTDHLSGRIGWAHLNMEKSEGSFVTHGYAPKDLITFGLTYDWNKWKTSLDGYYFIRMDSENNHFEDPDYGNMSSFPHDKYAILNWNLDYAPSKNVSFYLKVENLLNTLYAERSDVAWHPEVGPSRWYSLPGRTFLMGMQMRF